MLMENASFFGQSSTSPLSNLASSSFVTCGSIINILDFKCIILLLIFQRIMYYHYCYNIILFVGIKKYVGHIIEPQRLTIKIGHRKSCHLVKICKSLIYPYIYYIFTLLASLHFNSFSLCSPNLNTFLLSNL